MEEIGEAEAVGNFGERRPLDRSTKRSLSRRTKELHLLYFS